LEGIVIKSTGSWYTVMHSENVITECKIKGNFRMKGMKTTNPCAVGDHVVFQMMPNEEIGVISEIKDRHNCIIRKSTNLSKQKHLLAANIDEAFLVVTVASPRTSTGFIDRFLVTAEAYHIPTTLLFNKIDIYNDEVKKYHNHIKTIYENAGYQCIEVSALRGDNIDKVIDLLKDKISLFSGHSGVGKSALINKIIPGFSLKTGIISNMHQKGKHTTTFAEMFRLPFGGFIIDTPGIKEFGMVDFSKEEVTYFFPEMKLLANKCQFDNCIHEHERICAIKQAVADGKISETRYLNYLNIINGREMDVDEWELK
jgi:ribosome biogenesis GTPase / thiamine phosphate phosphatase